MNQISKVMVALAGLCLVGCASETEMVEVDPAVPADQLVATLEKIAETGEYYEILSGLTMGLEQAGRMDEAVAVQNFNNLPGSEEVKKSARQLAQRLQKAQSLRGQKS